MTTITISPPSPGAKALPAPPAPPATAARVRARSHAHVVVGLLLVLHGLAHAGPGMWAAELWPAWFVTPVWAVAMVGLVGAGLGLAGVAPLARAWRQLAVSGAIASLVLLVSASDLLALVGLLLSPLVTLTALEWRRVERFGTDEFPLPAPPRRGLARAGRAVASGLSLLLLGWIAVVVLARPWQLQWGSTAEERQMTLPGDDLVRDARYRMDRAITIAAPADAVWPWLAQIGQDRGGFYSYDGLERLFGAGIRNADRIHPEWQQRAVGDLVPATPPGYLGGLFGERPGWRVVALEPGRAMVLEQWGAFVVRPQPDGRTSRLHIRLRGEGRPSLAGVVLGPLGLLAFEPAHFIMERGMLLGIRTRAEGVPRRA